MSDKLTSVMIVAPRLAVGGLENVLDALRRGLSLHNMLIDIVCGSIELTTEYNPLSQHARVITPNGRWRFAERLIHEIRRTKPDVVMSTANDVAAYCWLASRLSRPTPKLIVGQHLAVQAPIDAANSPKERGRLLAMKGMLQFAIARADACVPVSTPISLELLALGAAPSKTFVIHNPVIGSDVDERLQGSTQWPWNDTDKPTIVFCGRLAQIKRLDVLLDAFQLCHAQTGARLLVLGDGPLLPWLRAQITARSLDIDVRCVGFVRDPLPYLARSNVLALTSDAEGFGNAIVEALAAGIPVVSTDCPSGPAEILNNGEFGFLAPCGDPVAIAHKLVCALDGKAPSTVEARKARAQDFNERVAIGHYAKLIEKLVRQ